MSPETSPGTSSAIRIGFRPVEAADLCLLRDWISRPHWQEWWGDLEEEVGFIRAMLEGRDSTLPFILEIDGAPAGYIQAWFVGHYQHERWLGEHPWLAELPSEAVGVDLSLADVAHLSRGIGSAALAAFVRMLRERGHRTIVIDPDRDNARAIRAYAKSGFRPLPALEGRTGDVLIMQYNSNADGMT